MCWRLVSDCIPACPDPICQPTVRAALVNSFANRRKELEVSMLLQSQPRITSPGSAMSASSRSAVCRFCCRVASITAPGIAGGATHCSPYARRWVETKVNGRPGKIYPDHDCRPIDLQGNGSVFLKGMLAKNGGCAVRVFRPQGAVRVCVSQQFLQGDHCFRLDFLQSDQIRPRGPGYWLPLP